MYLVNEQTKVIHKATDDLQMECCIRKDARVEVVPVADESWIYKDYRKCRKCWPRRQRVYHHGES